MCLCTHSPSWRSVRSFARTPRHIIGDAISAQELSDEALAQPVIITRHGRDRLVVMSLAKYRELTNPGEAKQSERANTARRRSAKPAASSRLP
jgi:PHD/YefM family antitoxin component YafN of YafNO toxin-antitoxin module